MYINKYKDEGNDFNDCTSRGNCTTSPEMSAYQEVLIQILKQLAFYERKNIEYNTNSYAYKESILYGITFLISTNKYTKEQLLKNISSIYSDLLTARNEYKNYCKTNNLKYNDLKLTIKLTPQMTLTEIIRLGEKSLQANYKKLSGEYRNLYQILQLTIKSISINIINLLDYDLFEEEAYTSLIDALNIIYCTRITISRIKRNINILAKYDLSLTRKISETIYKKFGEIKKKSVSTSTIPGKALLVSGSNLNVLYDILEKSNDSGFSVYTHAELLIAHSLEKFGAFKQLKGHYGTCLSNCVLDFATFPGPILLTKSDYPNIDYLYRGKLFSSEKITPHGVIKLKNDNYQELFDSVNDSKGFSKGKTLDNIEVGYNDEELNKQLIDISEKLKNNIIDHLIILGRSDFGIADVEYYKKIQRLLPEKSFILSFSYNFNSKNQLYINVSENLPIAYNVVHKLLEYIEVNSSALSFFFTKCDFNSISNIISLSNLGAKKIFLSPCPSYVINPNILNTLKDFYNINITSTPSEDVKKILE